MTGCGFAAMGLEMMVIGLMALLSRSIAPRFRTDAIARAAIMGFVRLFFAPVFMRLVSEAFRLRTGFALVAVVIGS